MNKTVIAAICLGIIIFSGCIGNESVVGKYVHRSGAFFILNEDMTFYETFSEGYTASGEYTIEPLSGNLTMVYKPFGNFIIMEKTDTGYKNKYGGIYEKK